MWKVDMQDLNKLEILSAFTGRSCKVYLGPEEKCSRLHANIPSDAEKKKKKEYSQTDGNINEHFIINNHFPYYFYYTEVTHQTIMIEYFFFSLSEYLYKQCHQHNPPFLPLMQKRGKAYHLHYPLHHNMCGQKMVGAFTKVLNISFLSSQI